MIKTYEEFSEVLDRRYRELKPIKWKYPYKRVRKQRMRILIW